MQKTGLVLLVAGVVSGSSWWVAPASAADDSEPAPQVDFRRDIWPMIEQKCLRCHNPEKKDGALDMSTRAAMLEGGYSGPALVPGKADESLMIELIEFDEMPPREEEQRVTKAEFQKLRAWIAAGAPVDAEKQR